MQRLGKLGFKDSGPIAGSDDYTTVVVVHGLGWASGIFSRIEPYMAERKVRLVLVNRRDYPGAVPYTAGERAQLADAQTSPDAHAILQRYMLERARELYDFLALFVQRERIPPVSPNGGGIILVAWSFGSTWLLALLANITTFTTGPTNLRTHIRRTILYDPPCTSLGYTLPADGYHPLHDTALPPPDRPRAFAVWMSGYFTHGNAPASLEQRTPVAEPPPTIPAMSAEDLNANFHAGVAGPGGSDLLLLQGTAAAGVNPTLRKAAFFLGEEEGDDWGDIELRYLWCDRSPWEVPWGVWTLRRELEEAKTTGVRVRNVRIARLAGANHFAHWDQPGHLVDALLAE